MRFKKMSRFAVHNFTYISNQSRPKTMRQSLYFLLILFAFAACKKDDDNNNSGTNTPPNPEANYDNPQLSGTTISADFFGRITSPIGENIEGALVEIGNKSTTTNSFGFYEIDNALVDQNYAVIEVTAPSFFKQFRSFNPKPSSVNLQDIQMIPIAYSGAYQTSTGGTVQIAGGGQVIFQAGDLVNSDGEAYTGQVAVATTYLNPTDPSLPSYLPGSLLAVDTDGEMATMITYGMAGIELYGSNGQSLQLAEGMTASLEMPIQPEQAAFAPETIPLWFFDETNGIWREDGVATKTGDKYVGSVSHFTFWNCDVPGDWAYLEGSVVYDGVSYNQTDFYFKVVRPDGSWATGYINSDGTFSGAVPSNESLEFYIINTQCDFLEQYYTTVAPIGTGQTYNMGEIDLSPFAQFETTTFTASVVDCDGNPLSGYIVDMQVDNTELYTTSNSEGQIDFIISCATGSTITVTYNIIDMDEAFQSIQAEIVLNASGDNYDLGDLAYCETQALGEYLTYSEGVNSKTMNDLSVFASQNSFMFLYGFEENNGVDSSDIARFAVNALPEPGLGATELYPTPAFEQNVFYQLDNGNYYKAVFDEDQAEVTINSAQFDPSNSTIPEKFDLTISGPVEVFIYTSGNTTIDPIDQYTTNATVEYYYWPE
jgi:hypothetical protein